MILAEPDILRQILEIFNLAIRPSRPTAQPARPRLEKSRAWNPAGVTIGVHVLPRSREKSEPEGPTVIAIGGLVPGTKATVSRKPPGRRSSTASHVFPPSAVNAAFPTAALSAL